MKHGSIKLTLSSVPNISLSDVQDDHNGLINLDPYGLLNLLETRLGVNTPSASFTSRLVDYLNCLEQIKDDKFFFFRSYQADPWAVARKLLLWRDELYLGGWTGIFSDDSKLTQRLRDLAIVEKRAKGQVEPGVGERWQYVLKRLQTDPIHISEIVLQEPLEYFEPLIRQVICATGATLNQVDTVHTEAAGTSDLDQAKNHILFDGPSPELSGDETILLIEAENFSECALVTSQIIAKGVQVNLNNNDVIICQNGGHILDEKLEELGLPRSGYFENSPWRPAFQVLPLALELLWDPVSPRTLIQFLTNPVCPLPSRARYRLARLIADKPGIGSADWVDTIKQLIDNEEDAKRAKKLGAEIDYWLECERFDPEIGIEITILLNRIEAVSTWLGMAMSIDQSEYSQSLYSTAKGQAEDLSNAVQRLSRYNEGVLTRTLIRRLIDDVRGVGAPVVDRTKEYAESLGAISAINHPGSIKEDVTGVIWTAPSGGNLFQLPFVSDQERFALSEQGIKFITESDKINAASEHCLRPLSKAKSRLILISAKDRNSDHPLWSRIKVKCPGIKVFSPQAALDKLAIIKTDLPALSLPVKKREWQIPAGTDIPKPDYSSYSSLDKFLYKPHQWMLSYPARIKKGSLIIADEGNLLKGKLAHRLIEFYLGQHQNLQKVDLSQIESWTENALPKLLMEEGAVLLEEGAFRERVEFLTVMKVALKNLITQLVDAGITKTETEKWEESQFIGGSLQGSIDILADTPDGERAIIDIKYGGLPYRREELEKSQYLQLATYDRLNGGTPFLSYFIIRDAQMLNLAHNFFKFGERVDPEADLTPDQYWETIELMWSKRDDNLKQGIIEVPVKGTEPNERSAPSGIALDIPETNDAFSDYTVLTGWEIGS